MSRPAPGGFIAFRAALAAGLGCLLLAGCHVTESGSGDQKNVAIGTPFFKLLASSMTSASLMLAMSSF